MKIEIELNIAQLTITKNIDNGMKAAWDCAAALTAAHAHYWRRADGLLPAGADGHFREWPAEMQAEWEANHAADGGDDCPPGLMPALDHVTQTGRVEWSFGQGSGRINITRPDGPVIEVGIDYDGGGTAEITVVGPICVRHLHALTECLESLGADRADLQPLAALCAVEVIPGIFVDPDPERGGEFWADRPIFCGDWGWIKRAVADTPDASGRAGVARSLLLDRLGEPFGEADRPLEGACRRALAKAEQIMSDPHSDEGKIAAAAEIARCIPHTKEVVGTAYDGRTQIVRLWLAHR